MTTDTALIAYPAQNRPEPAVTLVTALAETSDLSDDEYRQIYDQVAAGRSLRNIELALQSGVTFGWWAKYASGEKQLDRERKNELRRWAGLPLLPPSVAEAVTEHAHPDAAVYQVGEQIASRIMLVGADVASVNLRINGNVSVESPHAACIARYRPRNYKSLSVRRATWERLNAARVRSGMIWDDFLARLAE